MTNLCADCPACKIISAKTNTGKISTEMEKKKDFLTKFSLQQWDALSHREKQKHSIHDCVACETSLINDSILHNSTSENAENLVKMTNEIVGDMCHKNSSGAEQLLNVLEPLMKKTFKVDLKSSVAKKFNLTEKTTSEQKRKEKIKITRETKNTIHTLIGNNENEVQNFLASGKSYSQADRDRLSTFFEAKSSAKKRVIENSKKKKKSKKGQKRQRNTLEV